MSVGIICIKSAFKSNRFLYNICTHISAELNNADIEISNILFCENDPDYSVKEITNLSNDNNIVLVIGGYGHNLSVENAFCNIYDIKTVKDPLYSESRSDISENVPLIPENAETFYTENDSFCSFAIKTETGVFIFLPDTVENFLTADTKILPFIFKLNNLRFYKKTLSFFDINSSKLKDTVNSLSEINNAVNIYTEEKHGITTLNITAYSSNLNDTESIRSAVEERLKNDNTLSLFSEEKLSICEACVETLKKQGLTCATAESCTGGMISKMITGVSGASAVMEMGLCAYSNKIKETVLNVPKSVISAYGAVSKETAAYMAKGIKELSGASLGISVTGVAGPSMSENKPVGTVYIALFDGEHYWIRKLHPVDSELDRNSIRTYAVNTALDLLRRYACFYPDVMPNFSYEDNLVILNEQPDFPNEEKTEISDNFSSIQAPLFGSNYKNGFQISEEFFKSLEEFDVKEAENLIEQPAIHTEAFSKKPKKKNRLTQFLLFLLISVFSIGAIIMAVYFISLNKEATLKKSLYNIYTSNTSDTAFSLLKEKNPDYAAWLSFEDTSISFPVCCSSDNKFYLNHNFNRNKNSDGTIFADKNCYLTKGNISNNLVLYGKNVKSGNMFSSLIKYESVSYANTNSLFTLDFGDEKKMYQLFAVIILNADANDDNGYIFPFNKSTFRNTEEFENWYNELTLRSIIKSDIQLSQNDSILSLVTNYNAFENSRFVVMAKEVSEKENVKYSLNPYPKYPQIWYDNKGIENPF